MVDIFRDDVREMIAEFIKNNQDRIDFNRAIFEILEGDLTGQLLAKMKNDLGPESYEEAVKRIAPINVLRKVVDKQTRIYSREVIREVLGPNVSDADRAWLSWYEETLNINSKLMVNNENYNAYLYALLHISLKQKPDETMGTPFIRTIPNHQFLIWNSPWNIDPTVADVVIVCLGEYKDNDGRRRGMFALHSDSAYLIINDSGDILSDQMLMRDADGINPYGVLPFTYANASSNLAMPLIQMDNREMTLLIPLLLTDLNYAVKFQAFSCFVAIDMKEAKISISPNAVIHMESNPKGEKPSFEAIKPTVDIADSLNLAASEMGLWLTSKGIRPGSIANIGADSFASGVSKMIDESDSYESEKKQIKEYEKFERNFWNTLARHIHPVWVASGRVENKHILSEGAYVKTTFSKPVPLQTRREMIDESDAEVSAGFTTRRIAIKRLNPNMNDEEIDQMIADIDEEILA